jgi:hypothetical protein
MLFDLRSRGRRRTVQVIYAGLAGLMFFGLVLFGVGAGNGFGGLLNAFSGGGGGSSKQVISTQEKQALAAVKANPNSPAAWSSLVQARYTSASQGNDYNSATGTFTSIGKAELGKAMVAYRHYLTLTKKPDPTLAVLAARAYGDMGQFKNEAGAWQIVTAANPNVPTYYEDLALAAYQAKDLSLGDLAAAKAVSLSPKASQAQLKQQLQSIRAQAGGAAAATTPSSTGTSSTATSTVGTASTTTSTTSKSGKKK